MKTTPCQVVDAHGTAIPNSKGLLWGNNAAWACADCARLCGNRTGDHDYLSKCSCGVAYEILRAPSKKGTLHLGRAVGVKRL